LPSRAALVEYFVVKEQFVAALVTKDSLRIVGTTPVSRAANLVRLLRFQLSKFALGADYVGSFQEALAYATRTHLQELYRELIAPLREHISAGHLIFVPHGVLHSLPFHALFDGEKYLIDQFSISYAPSAGVYAVCEREKETAADGALVLGVPDERAPLIEEEVRAVAKMLPKSRLVIGAELAGDALRRDEANYRIVHIATHGNFRQDNPMFSGIRLGRSYLNLYDLYQLKLHAELVTLSGCATGLNVVTTGDELLGLARGLLYAGARSLLLTLWDVHDRSTSDFMSLFYERIGRGQLRANAFQQAVRELRERYPHPFHWAPFTLTGRIFAD
jgi:CHAT domain-containing protein